MSELYLVHHGIKGQRWGVRRYQNEDGSLTPAGKLHYRSIGEAFRSVNAASKKYSLANANLLNARIKQAGKGVGVAAAYVRKQPTDKAIREYKQATNRAHKAYAQAVDAAAQYKSSTALTKRGAIRARQNYYRQALAMNDMALTKSGRKQYDAIVAQSQVTNGKAITEDLVRKGRTDKYMSYVSMILG